MFKTVASAAVLSLVWLGATGCSIAPRTEDGRDVLHDQVQTTVREMQRVDPDFRSFIDDAYGYAVFPNVGKGGFVVGAGYGRGEVYRQGEMVGFADIRELTAGATIGGHNFSEVLVFQDKSTFDKFINNRIDPLVQAQAVALKASASKTARFTNGVAAFVHSKGGLMADASIGGQQFRYKPEWEVEDRND